MNRAKAPALALLVAASASAGACGLNQAGVEPPKDTIAFPASAVMDSSGFWLFVTNSNADLRYNDGTLVALSLKRAEDDRRGPPAASGLTAWPVCPLVDYSNPRSDKIDEHNFCCWDALNNNVLNCDERFYVGAAGEVGNGNKNVRIGSFAAAMVLQERECPFYTDGTTRMRTPSCPTNICDPQSDHVRPDRLMIGVRGDTSLTFVDVTPGTSDTPPVLDCAPPDTGDFVACDDNHRIIKTNSLLAAPSNSPDAPDVNLPDEPYALAVDKSQGLLFIGHLTGNTSRPFTGGFSLFDVMPRGDGALSDPPRLIAPFPSPFAPNSLGSVGISALKERTDENGSTIGIYASSRYVPQVAPLGVTTVCPQDAQSVREIAAFPSGAYFNSPLLGGEMRGIEFVEVVEPGSQVVIPECADRTVPGNASCACTNGTTGTRVCGPDQVDRGCACGNGAFALQRTPPALIHFDEFTATPTDILETCASPTFLDQIDTGVGPRLFVTCFADGEVYVFDPSVPRLMKTFQVGRGPSGLVYDRARQVAYVVGFGDNNISVVDLAPGHTTEYSVVQRIGFPRTAPR
jgi:hypothetical protein